MGPIYKYNKNSDKISRFNFDILPADLGSYHSSHEASELCIWRFVSSRCHSCRGDAFHCGAYLSLEEIERREKERTLEESLRQDVQE